MENAIYHACRVAFNCGADGVPWHMTCHALRQGLGLKDSITYMGTRQPYKLTEKDFADYPGLREMVDRLVTAKRGY